jgi:hypothetical protein
MSDPAEFQMSAAAQRWSYVGYAGAVAVLGLLTFLIGLGFLALVGFFGGVLLLIVRLVFHRGPSPWLLLAVIAASLLLAAVGAGGGGSGGSVSQAAPQDAQTPEQLCQQAAQQVRAKHPDAYVSGCNSGHGTIVTPLTTTP